VLEDTELVSKTVLSHEDSIAFSSSLKMHSRRKGTECTMSHGLGFVTQGFQWTPLFRRKNYWPCVAEHPSDIHCACHFTFNKMEHTTLSCRCHVPPPWKLPGRWIWRRGSVEYTASPDLTPLYFHVSSYLQDAVYRAKQATLEKLTGRNWRVVCNPSSTQISWRLPLTRSPNSVAPWCSVLWWMRI
jgi:hypothetical protein